MAAVICVKRRKEWGGEEERRGEEIMGGIEKRSPRFECKGGV
jgi:hypothetical protein